MSSHILGCSQRAQEKAKDAVEQAKDAANISLEDAAKQKDQFLQQAKKQMETISKQMENLKSYGKDLSGMTKDEYREHLQALEVKQKELQEQISKLQDSSLEAWQELSKGFQNAYSEMSTATGKAIEKFKKKS